MNNFKKIGLTALASSLVVTSAVAGELTASGASSIAVNDISKTSTGKNWSMANSVTLAGSTELDNGLTVALSFELDNGASNGTSSPFDNHSTTISSDAMGTLVFSGHGGSSAHSALDATAAGDIWNNTLGITGPTAARSGNNSMHYTLPSLMDGVAVTASYSPGVDVDGTVAAHEGQTSFGLVYTGVEGLSLTYAQGESGAPLAEVDHQSMKVSYAIGSFTAGYSKNDEDKTGASNDEVSSYKLSYTVSDDLSITYGSESHETVGSATDEEVKQISVSYTSGGVTLTAAQTNASGVTHSAGATGDKEKWALTAAFAF